MLEDIEYTVRTSSDFIETTPRIRPILCREYIIVQLPRISFLFFGQIHGRNTTCRAGAVAWLETAITVSRWYFRHNTWALIDRVLNSGVARNILLEEQMAYGGKSKRVVENTEELDTVEIFPWALDKVSSPNRTQPRGVARNLFWGIKVFGGG